MKQLFGDALLNFPLICAGSAWILAQIIKVFTGIFKQRKFSIVALLWGSGGMPSSHTASVCALVCACGLYTWNGFGVRSAAFAVAFVLSSIVMTDATGVRKEAGEHAKILNYMMAQWFKTKEGEEPDENKEFLYHELKELVGHTSMQVFVGAILGFALPFLMRLIVPDYKDLTRLPWIAEKVIEEGTEAVSACITMLPW